MPTTNLRSCELLFPSPESPPRGVAIVGATGTVGFGKLCQLAGRLATQPGPAVPLIAVDPNPAVLQLKEKLRERLSKSLDQAVIAPVLDTMLLIHGSAKDLPQDLDIGWALEAVPEDLTIKKSVYQALLGRNSPPGLVASTTSAYTSQTLFGEYPSRDRCAVLHPFFPHHKNPLWELVSKRAVTSASNLDRIRTLMAALDFKVIEVADVPAFAADRVFCGLMLHAVKASEELGIAPQTIDEITMDLIGCAPFRVHNMIPGSNALSMHCMELCHQEHPSTLFALPQSWAPYRSDPRRTWRLDDAPQDKNQHQAAVQERMLGALACICAYLLRHEVVTPSHLDQLCTDALAFRRGPCRLFREFGVSKVQTLARSFLVNAKITHPDQVAPLDALELLG